MAKVYKGPYWNGKPEHDQNIYDLIASKARRMRASRPEFKAGISEDDFIGEAFLLFETRKVHKAYDPSKGDFYRFFGVSLRNTMIDKLATTYGHVKSSRTRADDADHIKTDKFSGSEMAIQRLDDENLHERVSTMNEAPESVIGLEEYEETIQMYAPTLSTVWFGDVKHPHEMVHPSKGHPLKLRAERLAIIRDEADRMLSVVGDYLFDHELSSEKHEALVEVIVEQFSRWRGERGEYQKKEKIPDPDPS